MYRNCFMGLLWTRSLKLVVIKRVEMRQIRRENPEDLPGSEQGIHPNARDAYGDRLGLNRSQHPPGKTDTRDTCQHT